MGVILIVFLVPTQEDDQTSVKMPTPSPSPSAQMTPSEKSVDFADETLGIRFTYPASWGKVNTYFFDAGRDGQDSYPGSSGQSYYIHFSNNRSISLEAVTSDYVAYAFTGYTGGENLSTKCTEMQAVETDIWPIFGGKGIGYCDYEDTYSYIALGQLPEGDGFSAMHITLFNLAHPQYKALTVGHRISFEEEMKGFLTLDYEERESYLRSIQDRSADPQILTRIDDVRVFIDSIEFFD